MPVVDWQVLVSRILLLNPGQQFDKQTATSLQNYRKTADAAICSLLPDSPTATRQRTKGLLLPCVAPLNTVTLAPPFPPQQGFLS